MGIPRRLQVPLSIDTSISYDLDKTLFPGLEDPHYKHEPVLLIASEYGTSHTRIKRCEQNLMASCHPALRGYQKDVLTPTSHKCVLKSQNPCDTEVVDTLMADMDIITQDFLSKLKNTEEYLTLVEDLLQGIPHSDELKYVDGPQRINSDSLMDKHQLQTRVNASRVELQTCAKSNGVKFQTHRDSNASKMHTHRDSNGGRMQTHVNTSSVKTNRAFCLPMPLSEASKLNVNCEYSVNHRGVGPRVKDRYVSNANVLPPSGQGQISRKRKHVGDFNGHSKRACHGREFMTFVNHYQKSWMNDSGFIGQSQVNQIRVM